MPDGENPTRTRGRRKASSTSRVHPLSDVAEAENARRGALRASDSAPITEEETGDLESLKKQATEWTSNRAFQTLRGLACAVTADLELGSLVREILMAGVRTIRAERGILLFGRGDSAGFVPVMALNVRGEELRNLERVSRTILQNAHDGIALYTDDALEDDRLRNLPSVKLNQIRSIICTPLNSQNGRIGALYLDASAPNAFAPDAAELITAFADVAARALENARIHRELVQENAKLRRMRAPEEPFSRLIGSSQAIDAIRRQAQVAAQMDAPILIHGERGTGRELLARAIHDASLRSFQPFVACDCSAVPQELLKGVLLGRTGVAAAGAYVEEIGLLPAAGRGTLYLAEAEFLGVELGDQLAHILKRGAFRSMGGRRDLRADVRMILGTGKDLEIEVKHRRFSENLFRVLQGLSLWMPPLRERSEDIPELASRFLRMHESDRDGGTSLVLLTPAALRMLRKELWPGNVEELEHVVRRLLLFSGDTTIDVAQVKDALIPAMEEDAKRQGPWSGLTLTIAEWEREAVRQAMIQSRGNMTVAARLLGVHRNTLVRKVREMDPE